MNITNWIRGRWRHFRRRRKLQKVVFVESMNDVPESVGATLYVVYRSGQYRRAVLQCPCRCGRRIDLNLNAHQFPHWTAKTRKGVVTLSPSIWVPIDACGSHFFVRQNRIEWVNENVAQNTFTP
jgi:hypothetical protein